MGRIFFSLAMENKVIVINNLDYNLPSMSILKFFFTKEIVIHYLILLNHSCETSMSIDSSNIISN